MSNRKHDLPQKPEYDLQTLIPLKELAKRIPSHVPGKRIHLATLYRWVLSGRLEAVRIGGHYYVTPEAAQALVQPVAVPAQPEALSRRSDRRRHRAEDEWAKRVLDEAGI